MSSLFALLFLASLIFLVMGLFSPRASLFWIKAERTRKKSALIYGILAMLFFVLFGALSEETIPNTSNQTSKNEKLMNEPLNKPIAQPANVEVDDVRNVEESTEKKETEEEQAILTKLKARVNKDWPNNYSTQEFWVNEQIEDYRYMKTIPDNPIKKQAQRDWPLDFSTQKYWYNEQIEAKERLGQ